MKVLDCKECLTNLKQAKPACKKHKKEWESYLQIDKESILAEQRAQRFSENTQHIYRMHPATKTPFGRRIMTEVGTIQGLRIDTTFNYVLIPVTGNGKVNAWHIVPLTRKLEEKNAELDEAFNDVIIDAIKKADKGEPYDEWRLDK